MNRAAVLIQNEDIRQKRLSQQNVVKKATRQDGGQNVEAEGNKGDLREGNKNAVGEVYKSAARQVNKDLAREVNESAMREAKKNVEREVNEDAKRGVNHDDESRPAESDTNNVGARVIHDNGNEVYNDQENISNVAVANNSNHPPPIVNYQASTLHYMGANPVIHFQGVHSQAGIQNQAPIFGFHNLPPHGIVQYVPHPLAHGFNPFINVSQVATPRF